MPRRLLAPALVALAVLLASGCADSVSPAVRVGADKIGNDEFLAEVAEWAGNPAAVDPSMLGEPTPGTFPLELARQLLQQRIDFTLHNQEFAKLGLELDEAMREQALTVLFGDPSAADAAFSEFSAAFAAAFTDDVARQIAVSEALGEDLYGTWRTEAYAETDIEVSPRYGSWDPESGQIVAPTGPVTTVAPFTSAP